MNEEIPLSVCIKNAEEANELAEKFVLKNRVLKDTQSIGGFKMSQENLKKRGEGFKPEYDYSTEGFGKNTFKQNQYQFEGNGSYNNINSTNYKTNSEGKFYTSNMMNSTSKKLFFKF